MLHPLFRALLLDRKGPTVRLLDLQTSATDLTTYTFTGCNLNLGASPSIAGDDYLTHPMLRSAQKTGIVINVHGLDAATAYTVSSIKIGGAGGVAGTVIVDTGGSLLGSCATFYWDTLALGGIANTDVVVVFSEAVTSCAIGIVEIGNLALFKSIGGFATSTTAGEAIFAYDVPSADAVDVYTILLGAMTCEAASNVPVDLKGMAPTVNTVLPDSSRPPELLYEGSNGEFAYAAAYAISYQYNHNLSHSILFSMDFKGGTGTGNGIGVMSRFL